MKKIIFIAVSIMQIILLPIVFNVVLPITRGNVSQKEQGYKSIISLWHIDTFEGGIGSRYDYLLKRSLSFESKNKGIIVSVINHTVESAKNSINNGILPDMISYGVGVDFVLDYALELSCEQIEIGKVQGKQKAVAWCYGGYFLITNKTSEGDNYDKIIVSKNEYTLPYIALNFSGAKPKEVLEYAPKLAYQNFVQYMLKLSKKESIAFLGTQRDIHRLNNRGIEYNANFIEEYTDIMQYISVFTTNPNDNYYCNKFIEHLLSESSQKELVGIGMASLTKKGLYAGDDSLKQMENAQLSHSVSPFICVETVKKANEISKQSGDILKLLGGAIADIN